jgi:hypothetical protein
LIDFGNIKPLFSSFQPAPKMNDGPAVDLNEQVLAEPNAAAIELRRQLASANGSMVPGKLKVDYSAW